MLRNAVFYWAQTESHTAVTMNMSAIMIRRLWFDEIWSDQNKNHIKVGYTKHQNNYTPRLRRVWTVERVQNLHVLSRLPHAPSVEPNQKINKRVTGLGSLTVSSLLCHFAYPLRKIDPFFSFLRFSSFNVLLVKQWR